jgi:predicted MFS family arabinose efflux permease
MAGSLPDEESQASTRNPQPDATETTPLLNPSTSDQTLQDGSPATDSHQARNEEITVVAEEVSNSKLILILCTAWLGIFLGALDSTVIATLSAPISSEFHSLSLLSWLATAYLIATAACQPIAGRLTDIFGRRLGLALGNLLFAIGNLLCGLATDPFTIILGRVIAGIGGGGMISIATFLTSDLTPLRKRGIMQGVGNLWYGAGAMLGAVVGGLLNDHTEMGWRLAFLMQVPPALLLVPAVWFMVDVPPKISDKSYLARIDFLGVFLTVSFLVSLLLGLSTGGTIVPWTHPLPMTTLPLSAVLFAAFLWWESRAEQPIIPVRLLRDRTILAACLASFLISMVLLTATFYIPLYLQVLGDSSSTVGLKFLPSPLGGWFGALATGFGMAWTGRYKVFGLLGGAALTAGTAMFILQGESSPAYLTCLGLFFVGGGWSSVLATATVACLAAAKHSQQALVTSAMCTNRPLLPPIPPSSRDIPMLTSIPVLSRSVGGTVGITLASTIYQATLRRRLSERFGDEPHAPDEIRRIVNGLDELKHLPAGWRDGVLASFMEAFRNVWILMAGCAGLALVSIVLLRQYTLHSKLSRS